MRSILLASQGLTIDGGIASVSRCIASVLDEEVRAGRLERADHLLLNDPASAPPDPPAAGRQVICDGSKARFVWSLARLVRSRRPDLVLFDHVGPARAAALPGVCPAAHALVVHGIELDAAPPGSLFERAIRGASLLLTNSSFTAERVAARVPACRERIRILDLCVDPARVAHWETLDPGQPKAREPAALIVGRMWSEERGKGHDELLAAWPELLQRVPDAELWIVGGGDDVPRLQAEVRSRKLERAVRFLGRVDDAALAGLYRRVRVFAMPSRQEGFGLVYAEAMWHGLPCVASTADAGRDVVVDGETGALVPFGDVGALAQALAELLGDPERAAKLGRAGRERVLTRFSYPAFRASLRRALGLG